MMIWIMNIWIIIIWITYFYSNTQKALIQMVIWNLYHHSNNDPYSRSDDRHNLFFWYLNGIWITHSDNTGHLNTWLVQYSDHTCMHLNNNLQYKITHKKSSCYKEHMVMFKKILDLSKIWSLLWFYWILHY